jgi:hypothetical protein
MLYPLLLAATLTVAGPQVFAAERMVRRCNAAPLAWSALNPGQQELLRSSRRSGTSCRRTAAHAGAVARWLSMRDDERTNARRDSATGSLIWRSSRVHPWALGVFSVARSGAAGEDPRQLQGYQRLPPAKRAQLRQEWLRPIVPSARSCGMRQRRLERALTAADPAAVYQRIRGGASHPAGRV